jgi:hypothetical protein
VAKFYYYCHICARDAVARTQLAQINNPKTEIKPLTWKLEECQHQPASGAEAKITVIAKSV